MYCLFFFLDIVLYDLDVTCSDPFIVFEMSSEFDFTGGLVRVKNVVEGFPKMFTL